MITLFSITTIIILIYLMYPVWLLCIPTNKTLLEKDTEDITCVSVILLSFNCGQNLKDKVNFLIREIRHFEQHELIIIDDNSNDNSAETLETFRNIENVTIIYNSRQSGIPYSMNLGVQTARYDFLIFCDQRQVLTDNILKGIVEPLKYSHIGAVSCCISHYDKLNKLSFIRKHENFLKFHESRAGSLIGVYGPLYAIKKYCYSPIPENIILDDLYLSLKILKWKHIEIREDCRIFDDNFSILYDYSRTKRYLAGLFQILGEKSIIHDLNTTQRIMLFWHKYFRLIIPPFLFVSYLCLAISVVNGIEFFAVFCFATVFALLSLMPDKYVFSFWLKNITRMNILYFTAFLDIILHDMLMNRRVLFWQNHV